MLMDINSVCLTGRLGHTPELKYTTAGKAICTTSLAVSKPPRDGEEQAPNWIDLVCFEKTAEILAGYANKGDRIGIEGYLNHRTWEKDGQKRSKVEINVMRVTLLEPKRQESSAASGDQAEDDEDPYGDQ